MSNLKAIEFAVRSARHNDTKPAERLVDSEKLSEEEKSICLNVIALQKEMQELQDKKDKLHEEIGRKDADIDYLKNALKKANPIIAEEVENFLA